MRQRRRGAGRVASARRWTAEDGWLR
ncbi:hypothetical protein E2C01_096034 [Portunus trituberculatus]|uniref:Uncharacterized protein n=1 Tax=Portunus trituberculatus TaxID=210409 RepID=A0A5B7K773_PORTR|nr:hypothetical protein [Portunus trituberculatus]